MSKSREEKKSCDFCAGKDDKGIPINCLICRNNPKYIDRRKRYFETLEKQEAKTMNKEKRHGAE